MKNNKKILFISIIFVFLCITIISVVISLKYKYNNKVSQNSSENFQNEMNSLNLYYLDTTTNQLVFENRKLNISNSKLDEDVKTIFQAMKQPSKLSNTSPVIPENVNILSSEITQDAILKINFSQDYNKMNEVEEIFFISGLVWTMTELPHIENLIIYVDGQPITKGNGEPMLILNRKNIVLNPTISPDKIEPEEVILYFSDEEELTLVPEIRKIQVKQSKTLETQIVEQLILGPKDESNFATIPSETKIRNIKTEDGICYVDLSSDFINKQTGGSTSEVFAIYSIVNSLTELQQVNKVQFLIEGEKVSDYKGNLDISKPLAKKEF